MAFNIRGQQVSKHLIENLIQQYPKVQVQKLDWKRYLEDNPDLQEGNITNQLDAYNHAIHHGIYNNGRKLFDVNGKVFKYTFKHKIYESEISKKIPSEEAAYLDYCNSDTTCLHPYLKIKEPYVKYKSKISETFEEIEKIIVNYYSIDDLLINNNELDVLIDLLDVLNECREEDQELKEEEKRLLEAAIYLEAQNDIKKAEKRRKTEKERHDLLKKRDEQAKAMAEKLKKEQEEKLKQQRLEKEAEIKQKELDKIQKQQEEQKIKAAQNRIVEDMLNIQRKKRALDQRIRVEVAEKKKFFEEDKMNTLIMDVLNQKEVDFKGKKVLINTHTMLSVAAGDTIMIGNIVNLFLNTNSHVVILTKYNVGDVFLNNLISDNYTIVQKEDDKEIMDFIDENHTDFACLFFRNHEILQALKGKFYLYKTILYGLEIHIEDISKLNNNFLYTLTQSEELKNMYIEKGISKDKIKILDVITVKYDFELPEREDNEIRLIYSGTLRDEENILEIIEEFQKIHSERPEVVLKIVYGKIVDNGKGFKAKVGKIIENDVKGIIFKYGLSHKDACYEIATSDIGICWRKDGWGDDGQISTKLKEYEMYGLQIINEKKHLIDYELLQSIYNFKYIKKDDLILLNNYYNLNKVQKFKLPINKKLKINFIIMNLSHITKTNGYVNNELRIMTGLSKEFDVYYNDVLINDCIVNNFLDIEKLNNKIIKKINLSNNSHFYEKYYGIFKNSIDYDATYFRCDNSDYIKQLFNNIKGTKIFSHAYDYNMWKNEIIGFQTFISEYMCKKNILKNYKDDNTLNYNQIQIIPEKTTVRPSFLCKTIKKSKKMDNNFNICVIGQINNLNNIIEDLIVIFKEIMMETNKKIVLYLLSQNDVKINNSFIKRKYFNEHKKYLEFISSCDLAISTWVTDVALYSNSNKVLDCISAGLPIIVPHSFSLYDILGKDYPLFYKSHNYKSDIKKCILYSINNSNIKYNIDIEKYNTDIISYYYNSIVKMKSEILLLGVSSGKRYYGGIATNIDNYLTTMKDYNFNVSGIMYDHYISDCVTYENGLKHVKQSNIYTNLMKVLNESKSEKIVIILFSWIHTDVFNFLKKYKNVYIILCNPGLFVDQIENFYLDSPINCKKSDIQFNTIERSDFVYFNSQMSYEIAKCGTNCKVLYYNTPTYFKYVPWFEKKYDVGFIVSNTKRSIKNFNFFKKILDNFNLNKISINLIIVGLEPESVKDFQKQYSEFNIIFDFNISNEKSIDYISKTKVILNTSFFDCGPTTLFEAILCNTKYVTSKNVGGIELLDNDEIVEDYKSIDEWCKVITTNLKNEPNRTNNILDKLSPKNLINDILQHVN